VIAVADSSDEDENGDLTGKPAYSIPSYRLARSTVARS
jgi:hypothetical protein